MHHVRYFHWIAVFFVLLAEVSTVEAQRTQNSRGNNRAPGGGAVWDDAVFATLGGTDLLLDLRLPSPTLGEGPWPVALYIHGGGWQGGTHNRPAPVRQQLLAEGIAIASCAYRLTSEEGVYGDEPVTYPAQIHDVKGFIRFLKANAPEFNIDPGRILVYGTSAGGHLACVAGLGQDVPELEGETGGNLDQNSSVVAFLGISSPTDLLNMKPDVTEPPGSLEDHDLPTSSESLLIGFSDPGEGLGVLRENLDNPNPPFPELAELVRLASPVFLVDENDVPGMIIHGDSDTTVPWQQAVRLSDEMSAVNVENILIIGEGLGHVQTNDEIDAQMVDFIKSRLLMKDDSADGWQIR